MAKTEGSEPQTLPAGLYIAATPIGNLKDITYRVVDSLKNADAILCEDTRHTAKLCAAYGIETPRRPYHEHNAAIVRPELLRQLKNGARLCLVSDAGTPLISDPGYKLVADARAEDIDVFCLPGPCAAIAALSIGGLPTNEFHFVGFPPAKLTARRECFERLKKISATLVFYESAKRIPQTLDQIRDVLGDRDAAIARELTKRHESLHAGTLSSLADELSSDPLKGEIVLLVAPPKESEEFGEGELDAFLLKAIQSMTIRDAANAAADAFSISKKAAYQKALDLKTHE